MSGLIHKSIEEILTHYPHYASILFYYGIDFRLFKKNSLKEVCDSKKVDYKLLLGKFEAVESAEESVSSLENYSLDIILSYLKLAHKNFITYRIPFYLDIIKDQEHSGISEELSLVFPFFAEDFIKHIKEEEYTVFDWVEQLLQFKKKYNSTTAMHLIKGCNLKQWVEDHKDEDEFSGIRELTNNYDSSKAGNIEELVLLKELEKFDQEVRIHAEIENQVFAPKVIALGNLLSARLHEISKKN